MMSLEDVPDDFEDVVTPVKEEEAEEEQCEDYFGMDADDAIDEDDADDQEWVWEGAVDDGSRAYHPSAARYQLARGYRKRTKYAPRLWNMTYSHEQRVRMGYYAAKLGIKAAKKKFKGVKDSTARDMRKLARKLVSEGKLSLDIPLEKQVIPPKTRKGVPVLPMSLSRTEENAAEDESRPDDNREDLPGVSQEDTAAAFDFEKRVEIGFLTLLQGPVLAMKTHGVSESAVKECRNVVVKFVKTGQLSLDVPLEEQTLPNDPDKPIMKRGRGRPPKRAPPGRRDNPPPLQPLKIARISGNGMITRQRRPQTSTRVVVDSPQDHAISELPASSSNLPPASSSNLHRDAKSDQPAQRGHRDISLATDLAFLRWTNRRTSLGFRSDQAFAMHLMDVHDAFCADQCNGGGRHEQYQNGREEKD